MEVARLNDRFSESAVPSIHANTDLHSGFPPPTAPPREVIRCQSCSLVQFRTTSDLCRRCHHPLTPKLELDFDAVTAVDAADDPSKSWPEAPDEEPQIGREIKRLRRMRGISQGDLGRRVGLRRTYLSRVENDHVMPGPAIVFRIAQTLGVGIEDLFLPQTKRRANGTALREPDCVRLVEMFSKLRPSQMAEIVSKARQMCAAKPPSMEFANSTGSRPNPRARMNEVNASAA